MTIGAGGAMPGVIRAGLPGAVKIDLLGRVVNVAGRRGFSPGAIPAAASRREAEGPGHHGSRPQARNNRRGGPQQPWPGWGLSPGR